jgi:hypothetical protein
VRQRQIERLVASSEPWIAPFVTQLCDEYVIEILDAVEAHLSSMDQHTYGAFFRENSLFFQPGWSLQNPPLMVAQTPPPKSRTKMVF